MTYIDAGNSHMALSTGNDGGTGAGLTDWINGKAVFIEGELIPCDQLLSWSLTGPTYDTERGGSMTISRVGDRYSMGRRNGVWRSIHAFQTCQFIYWLMQTTGAPTTEGTPTDFNTHVLTVGATNIPDWHGIHFEREAIAENELRYDLMGFLPSDLVINCGQSKDNWRATQEITIPFAYMNREAENITAQTPRPSGTLGTIRKDWDHLVTGGGGGESALLTGLLYNSLSLEVDVMRSSLHLHRGIEFGAPDATAYPIDGFMQSFDYSIELDVKPIGNALYDLNHVKKESYVGELDFDFYYNADDDNDKIRVQLDKMFLAPFDENNDYKKWLEGYTITLEPFDKTSSLTVTGIDGLDKKGFENP